jgi:hypothetical protein
MRISSLSVGEEEAGNSCSALQVNRWVGHRDQLLNSECPHGWCFYDEMRYKRTLLEKSI